MYAYIRNKDSITAKAGIPYYIGKGKGNRYRTKHVCSVPTNLNDIIFIKSNLDEYEAFDLEIRLIRWYGRKDLGTGVLLNKSDGGDGSRNMSPITKKKLSEAHKGKKGYSHTEKHKKYMSQIMKGRKGTSTADSRIKTSNTLKNKTKEEKELIEFKKKQAREKMTEDQIKSANDKRRIASQNRIRTPHSEETIKRMRESAKNRVPKPHSEDTKRKIRESNQKTALLKR